MSKRNRTHIRFIHAFWYNLFSMAKTLVRYVCRACGFETPKWLGRCPSCEEWGALEETVAALPVVARSSGGGKAARVSVLAGRNAPMRLADVPSASQEGRATTGIGEFDRVSAGESCGARSS